MIDDPKTTGTVLEQFEKRYGAGALFQRYARARIRQLWMRQVPTVIGGIAVWYYVTPGLALFCVLFALLGEALDLAVLRRALARLADDAPLKRVLPMAVVTGGLQSVTIATVVLCLALSATEGQGTLTAFLFLMAGWANAGFIMTHARLVSVAKLTVLSLSVPIYFAVDVWRIGGFDQQHAMHALEIAMLGFTALAFLGFFLRSWARRMENERDLMMSAERLDRTNAELRTAQAGAEQAARAKSAFLATMSHEIRTPLNAVIGMSDLLAASRLDAEAQRNVGVIREASTSLLQIINDILDVSRLDADQMTLEARPFTPSECIAGVARLLGPLAEEKGLQLVLEDDGSLPLRASADAGRLRQILVNLVGNAIKFTHSGEVRVISCAVPKADGWLLRVQVADTGIGVPKDRAEAIFDTFQQADAAITRRFGGAGLGLPISRALARRMGGDIQLLPEARAGQPGSVFEVTLKLDRSPNEVPVQNGPLRPVAQGVVRPLRVLLAEDNATNRLLVDGFLKRTPVTLRMVENGRAAVDAVAQGGFDVVLMDMAMPELDGLEATRAIRALPVTQPWIIAVTANAFASDRDACLAAGMDAYLTKPLRKADLLAALSEVPEETQEPAPGWTPKTGKPLSPSRVDAVSGQRVAKEDAPWTSPPGSGTTNGRSIRSFDP